MHILISAQATVENLYQCSPLIVGDVFADQEIMSYLGAKLTQKLIAPNSPAVFVVRATPQAVMNALEELGFELKMNHTVGNYITWIMNKPGEHEETPDLDTCGGAYFTSSNTPCSMPPTSRSNKTKTQASQTGETLQRSKSEKSFTKLEDQSNKRFKNAETTMESPMDQAELVESTKPDDKALSKPEETGKKSEETGKKSEETIKIDLNETKEDENQVEPKGEELVSPTKLDEKKAAKKKK